jgi:hypothetical protein
MDRLMSEYRDRVMSDTVEGRASRPPSRAKTSGSPPATWDREQ